MCIRDSVCVVTGDAANIYASGYGPFCYAVCYGSPIIADDKTGRISSCNGTFDAKVYDLGVLVRVAE